MTFFNFFFNPTIDVVTFFLLGSMSLFNIYREVVDTCASANFLVGKTLPQVDSEGSPLERSKQAFLRNLDKYNRPPKNFISTSGQYLELLCCGHACSDCSFGRLRVLVGHSPGYPEVVTKVAEAYPQSACCLKTCQWIAAAQRKLTTIFCGKVSMNGCFLVDRFPSSVRSASDRRICRDSYMPCYTETEAANPTP